MVAEEDVVVAKEREEKEAVGVGYCGGREGRKGLYLISGQSLMRTSGHRPCGDGVPPDTAACC